MLVPEDPEINRSSPVRISRAYMLIVPERLPTQAIIFWSIAGPEACTLLAAVRFTAAPEEMVYR